ncbi:MAG: chromate resistance protein ChrB domain-containing protein [Patescibacteria group bacterium]
MKTIVTHLSVDLDCITAVWLIKRFFPGWQQATVVYTPQQTEWNNVPVDSNPEIIYVDTGFGRFDHHQLQEKTSASKRVFESIMKNQMAHGKKNEALTRIIDHVNDIDHFGEVHYPEPTHDRYDFCLHQIISGLKKNSEKDDDVMSIIHKLLDGILVLFLSKINAEKEIEKGYVFHSKWGKTLAMNTANDEASRLAQKQGYQLVITKDPERGSVRIKTPPNPDLDLTPLYTKIRQADTQGYWYLHVLKNMLLNGSSVTPDAKPTALTLKQLIEIIKKI